MDDCQSFSSNPKWMERECQSLMCLMARRDIESCPSRVLAQKAKTRGGTLEVPAYRVENFAVAGKISIIENMARIGLWKSTQRIAESSLGFE